MISSILESGLETESIAVSTDGVHAVLKREPDGTLSLKLKEVFPEVTEINEGQSIEDAIECIQRAEIERVARTLGGIRDQLAARVIQTGDTIPGMTRQARTEETRDWHVNAQEISIDDFTTTTKEKLTKPDGVSESSLIEAYFGLLIADRIQGIQEVYRQVSEDILAKQPVAQCGDIPVGPPTGQA